MSARERISDDYAESVDLARFCSVHAVRSHGETPTIVFDLIDPAGQRLQVMIEALVAYDTVGPLARLKPGMMASAWAGWGTEYPPTFNEIMDAGEGEGGSDG